MYFEDLNLDLVGKDGNNYRRYNLFCDEEANSESFTQKEAIEQVTQALDPYTDFDLYPFNIQKMEGNRTGANGYRIGLQLVYQDIPISLSSQTRMFGLDVVTRENRIGYINSMFLFDQICEEGSCNVMSLDEALTVLEQRAPELIRENNTWNVYHIQLEYFGEYDGSTPGLYAFRPVWTFYYRLDDVFDTIAQFYADTGAICESHGM